MALLFNNSNTKAENTTAAMDATKHSIVMWFKAKNAGGVSGLSRMVELGANGLHVRFDSMGTIWLERAWTVGGSWSIAAAASWYDNTTWIGLGITYDGTATTNNAVFWARRLGTDAGVVSQTVTNTSPTGTITAIAAGYNIGNRADGIRCFNGDIEDAQIFLGTILTQAQIDSALNTPGSVAGGIALDLRLLTNGTDFSANAYTATITNGVFEAGPPGIPVVASGAQRDSLAGVVASAPRLDAVARSSARLDAASVSTAPRLDGSVIVNPGR